MKNDEASRGADLVKSGAEIVGASALAAAGALFAGPAAAAVFGAAGVLLPRLTSPLIDHATRLLSSRERARVGAAATVAALEIRRRVESGEQLRSPEFFLPSDGTRAAAEEIFDGALQKARMQHEELKVPFIGHLFASVSFAETISRNEANRLLDLLDRLTYRKLCILALLHDRRRPDDLLARPVGTVLGPSELASVSQDCVELEAAGLIYQTDTGTDPSWGRVDWRHTVPAHLRLSELGKQLVDLAELHEIKVEDLEVVHSTLRTPR